LNIAIFSPSQNAYSETFIQVHKNFLRGNIFYYYGNGKNVQLENDKIDGNGWSLYIDLVIQKIFRFNKNYAWVKRLSRSLNKHKIDVLLIEYGSNAYDLLPMLRSCKIPFAVHFHGYDASVNDLIAKCNNYKTVFDLATKVIVVSEAMRHQIQTLGCPVSKIVKTVYGPNSEYLKIKPSYNSQQFIAIGRFTDKKAPYYTILAFLEVLKHYPKATLIMAGNGPLLNSCINLVKHYNVKSNIQFVGVVNSNELSEYLKSSIAFVQHSIVAINGDSEGTPVSVLEASLSGLPVIASKHAGIPDVIIDNETGLLFEEHHTSGMTKAMLKILKDPSLAKRLGETGKINISKNFNLNQHIKTLNTILSGIAK
jgi:glycosyltransferase involved in cell wall biosynthesis